MTRFSIIIPSWRNLPYLDLAYRSIVRHSAAEHEIIVFFNEFTPECLAWMEGKQIHALKSPENVGVCAAVNAAVKVSTCPYVCYFNDDMYALPGWDSALVQYLGLTDKLWLSGTAIEAGEATACYIGGQDYGRTVETFEEARLLREYPRLRRPYNVVSTWTPMLLSRADWDAVGGFDEGYFPGNGSDPDLAMKMYQYGCRHFIGVGSSLVYHFSRCTTARFDACHDLMDPKAYFEKKWGVSWRRFLQRTLRRDAVITPDRLKGLWPGI